MRLRIIAFTGRGALLAKKLEALLPESESYSLSKFAGTAGTKPVESLRDWCGRAWDQADGIVFVGAAGIAVRAIAPHVKSKTTDPAVVVVDEGGQFAISLLSGHIGGANDLARAVAAALGAMPVVTTATDVNSKFAVDVFAVKNRLAIVSMAGAKEVSAAILAGERVGLFSQWAVSGEIPPELALQQAQRRNIEIGFAPKLSGSLLLIPRAVYLGVGCKRGTAAEAIVQAVETALSAHGIPEEAVAGAASIDLKANEAGLFNWARERKLPIRFFTAEQLRAAPGTFTPSAFVQSVTGVDSVCERAAVLAARGGHLLFGKQAGGGITVAAAMEEVRIAI